MVFDKSKQLVASSPKICMFVLIVLCNLHFKAALGGVDETWGAGRTYGSFDFSSGFDLKKNKRMGLGVSAAGSSGLLGLHLVVNLSEKANVSAGYGFSRGFNAITLQSKYTFGGQSVMPYFVGGITHWYSKGSNEPVEKTSPGFFKKEFLNQRERESGQFGENMIYPGLGIEFVNLRGDWSGVGFFAEILYLLDIDDFAASPTAGIGTTLYF